MTLGTWRPGEPPGAGAPEQSRPVEPGTTGAAAGAAGAAPARHFGRRRRPPLPPHLSRLRRQMMWSSAPLVLLVVLAAARLITVNLFAERAIATYAAGDKPGAMAAAERLGWVNVVESWRYPFAVGDARVVAGNEDLARPWFESALAAVPTGGREECIVRVNLGLVYEHLGDLAAAREHADEARQFYDKGIETTKVAPAACSTPDPNDRNQKEELERANQRMQQKDGQLPPPSGNQDQRPSTPTPAPTNPPGQDKLDELDRQLQQNQRDHENGKQDNQIPTVPPQDPGVKPW